ncbi:MAG TPA: SUMF1/EgtB/PvdO family nonheme iron enzyme, partial [Thermotogota bacterium]|nr:SUMF1/EgtB/PvdO family nonheme iron enzyme [Thermotogota bacterium]
FLLDPRYQPLTLESSPSSQGLVSLNGSTPSGSINVRVRVDKAQVLEAFPKPGFVFYGWYEEQQTGSRPVGLQPVSRDNPFRIVPGGERTLTAAFAPRVFQMGNTRPDGFSDPTNSSTPVHTVRFTYDFWVSPFEFTHEEMVEFLNDTGVASDGKTTDGYQIVDLRPTSESAGEIYLSYQGDRFVVEAGKETHPYPQVSFRGATRVANWMSEKEGYPPAYDANGLLIDSTGATTSDITQVKGYRLPTDAEWEYCARGGDADFINGVEQNDTVYSGSADALEVAWVAENSGDTTHPVGQKKPNEGGYYDMTGNVSEWVTDFSYPYSAESVENPVQFEPRPDDLTGCHLYRGGGFHNSITPPNTNQILQKHGNLIFTLDFLSFYTIEIRLARTLP